LARDKWLNEHPRGFFERRDAFGPQGIYGRWIRGHDAVAQIGDVVFVHGGLNPNIPFRDIRELNQRIHTDLATFDSVWQSLSSKKIIWRYSTIEEALGQAQSKWADLQTSGEVDPELREDLQKLLSFPTWFINSPDSPLWYRGLALESEEELKPGVDAMFARLRIGHIVAGHTINPDAKIARRFGERVFLIDTGMFETGSGDRASALEIQDGRFVEHYALDTPQTLMPADSANPSVGTIQKNSGPAR
jgi:hypothetical protein